MSAALPTGHRGRLLAVGLLGGALLAGWLGVAAPLLSWHAGREEDLADQRSRLRRLTALAGQLPELRRAATAPAPGNAAPSLLEGNTDAVAGAALQVLLRDMAGHVGTTLFSVETLPAAPVGNLRRVGLRISLAAPWPVLVRLLQAVEKARPRMVIDDLEIHNAQMLGDTAEALQTAGLSVYAFRGDADANRGDADPHRGDADAHRGDADAHRGDGEAGSMP